MASKRLPIGAILAALLLAFAPGARAQTQGDPAPPSLDELIKMIDAALPAVIKEDNTELARKLLTPTLGPPPSKTFDRGAAVRSIFGRLTPTFAPDCKRRLTEAGAPDPGLCLATRGSLGGGGALTAFEFSRNPAFGDFNFFKRGVAMDVSLTSLKPVALSDDDALKLGSEFLIGVLKLSPVELAPTPGIVKTLTLAQNSAAGASPRAAESIGFQKHVFIQRQALVGVDGLPYVRIPGRAVLLVDDAGVQGALVDGWGDVAPDPRAKPEGALGRRALVDQMARLALQDLDSPVQKVSTRIHLAGHQEGMTQLLVPAVQLWLSPVPLDLSESAQASRTTTAGVVHDVMLLPQTELDADVE